MSSGYKRHHQTLRHQQSLSNVFCRRQEIDKIPGCLLAANGITKHRDISNVSATSSVQKTGNRQDPGMSSGCQRHHQTSRHQQRVSNIFCPEDRKQTRSWDVFWLQTASPNIATSATCQQHLLCKKTGNRQDPGMSSGCKRHHQTSRHLQLIIIIII